MPRVGPFEPAAASSASQPTAAALVESPYGSPWSACFGFVYVVASVALSTWYLTMVRPFVANDLFWPCFNATGIQTFVIDAFNVQANSDQGDSASLRLLDMAIQKDYSRPTTVVALKSTYPRRMLHEQLTSIEAAIEGIVSTASVETVLRQSTAYCWLDFDRQWPVAHTQGRLDRCHDRYRDNAAVYMESVLRLVRWNEWMALTGSAFNASIGVYLSRSDAGVQWLQSVQNAFESVELEAAHWRQRGMAQYKLQWSNLFVTGLDASIAIRNALGMTQNILVYQVKPMFREQLWTSLYMNWGVWNDMGAIQFQQTLFENASLVRNSTDDYDSIMMYDYFASPWGGTVVTLIRRDIGPTNSIDLYVVPRPPAAVHLFEAFRTQWTRALLDSPSLLAQFNSIPDAELDPVPRSWLSPAREFYGGNPMCVHENEASFVQAPFGFDDSCASAVRHTVAASKWHLLFATMAVQGMHGEWNHTSVCDLCPTTSRACAKEVGQTSQVHARWVAMSTSNASQTNLGLSELILRAQDALVGANVSLIQFTADQWSEDGHYFYEMQFLSQALLTADDPSWNFLGWLHIYDWLAGTREVVSFEGDLQTLRLISTSNADHVYVPSSLEVPASACKYFRYISVYVTCVLALVAAVLVLYASWTRFHTTGRHLLEFNRVVGAIWIGRPFLFIRGVTALVVLSTAPVSFGSTNGIAFLRHTPRHWLETLVVAGEATWVAYVLHDGLLVVTEPFAHVYCPIATFVTWTSYVVLDIAAPVDVTAAIDRHCTFLNLDRRIACSTGYVDIGDVRRARLLLFVALGATLGSALAVRLCYLVKGKPGSACAQASHLIFPGASAAFLAPPPPGKRGLHLDAYDKVMCAMSGLLHFTVNGVRYVFDLKLWVLVPSPVLENATSIASAKTTIQKPKTIQVAMKEGRSSTTPRPIQNPKWRVVVLAGAGFVYMIGTIAASVSYVAVTQVNMANDFWWPNFNSSGTHAYLANWFNLQQLLHAETSNGATFATTLALPEFAVLDSYNSTTSQIQFNAFSASNAMVDMRTELADVVRGIRTMDGCQVPWISTQYCWLDFHQRWPMAHSEARQRRCQGHYHDNGAVYLEAVARNLNWIEFNGCWGQAFDVAFRHHLNTSVDGVDWLASVESIAFPSAIDEAGYWSRQGIVHYTTQWQNYKTLGIAEHFTVVNAFGVSYAMTLKDSKPKFRLDSQTSRKLSWGLSGDLDVAMRHFDVHGSASLLRGSANYMYGEDRGLSVEAAMIANGTLANFSAPVLSMGMDLPSSYQLLRDLVGPFGTIDAWRVPVPRSLREYTRLVTESVTTALASAPAAVQHQWINLPMVENISPTPPTLLKWQPVGGNPLCDYDWPRTSMFSFIGGNSACSTALTEFIQGSPMLIVFSLLSANAIGNDSVVNLTATSQLAIFSETDVETMFATAKSFVQANLSSVEWKSIEEEARQVRLELAAMQIQLLQFAMSDESGNEQMRPSVFGYSGRSAKMNVTDEEDNATVSVRQRRLMAAADDADSEPPIRLHHINVFDPAQADFAVFAWGFVFEWAIGRREVIALQGDAGTQSLLSTVSISLRSIPQPLEIPVNVAVFLRYAIIYITSTIFAASVVATVYIVVEGGHIEGRNMFKINRVAGIVFMGRPLLFLRSMAAMSLLSTATLQLDQSPSGVLTSFVANPPMTFVGAVKMFLAAGEVSWFTFVLNDVFMVVSQQYTSRYAFKCSLLVWLSSAMLSFWRPVRDVATLHRECVILAVDFDLACSGGRVEIGQWRRVASLMGLCVMWSVVCYVYERLRHPSLSVAAHVESPFLCASAKWMFKTDSWIFHEVYYLDKASAALNGTLVVQVGTRFYVLDVKSWRRFTIDVPPQYRIPPTDPRANELGKALPLF